MGAEREIKVPPCRWPTGAFERPAHVGPFRPGQDRSVELIEHEPDDAVALLIQAADTIQTRGEERDQPGGERSMARAIAMFNALKGTNLSETDGWDFMECLKMSRAQGGAYRADDYTDRIGYAALAAESAAKTNK